MAMPAWGYLQYCVPDDDTVYVMNAPQDAGGNILLAPINPGQYGQLFQFASDGHILLSTAGYVAGLTTTTNLTKQAYDVSESGEQDQVWRFGPQGQRPQIVNSYYGSYLGIAGDDPEGFPPIVAAFKEPAGYWQLFPANPLDAILDLPPMGFPQFTGEQLTAYDYIETSLVPQPGEDLRSEYTNLNAPLTQWSLQIADMRCPPKISSQSNWDTVRQQLGIELSAVISVQMLFSNYSAYQGQLLTNQQNELVQCGLDMAIGADTNTNVTGMVVWQGILYTVLEEIPVIGGVLGNIVNTALSGALAAKKISPSPTLIAYAELWSVLSQTFLAVSAQAAWDEKEILSNWNKLRATAALTVRPGSRSLMWTVGMTNQLLTASRPGYEIQVMQILLPSSYQIYTVQNTSDEDIDGLPGWAQWIEALSPNGPWIHYWIGQTTDCKVTPPSAAMNNDVWGNGAEKPEFFKCLSGWNFAVALVSDIACTQVTVTFANQTTSALQVQAQAIQDATIVGPATQMLYPYASAQLLLSIVRKSFEATISVFQYDGGTAAGAFTITMEENNDGDYMPVISGQTPPSSGYALSQPVCNQGSAARDMNYSAAVQVTIGLAPS